MVRKIIQIDEQKCDGCGICVEACHEGAIGMVDGKAKLLRDDYCDGLGDCLPACPQGAITFVEREAAPYEEAAVLANKKGSACASGGCPSSMAKAIHHPEAPVREEASRQTSQLRQWPVQIKLVPVAAPWFQGSKLLIAADCTAFAYANFHQDFIKDHITLVGCPKLDSVDYTEKLTAILQNNDIKSLTVVRMEVPCCGGIQMAAQRALQASGKFIPWQVVTISTDGRIVDRT